MDPRNIIREVLDGRDSGQSMLLARGLKHETETYVIAVAVSSLTECLPGIAVTKVVNPLVADGPGMTSSQAPGMVPHQWRRSIGQPLWECLVIVDYIQAAESCLVFRQIEVKLSGVRV